MNKTPNKYLVACIYLLLTFATVIVFWQVHKCDFIMYDDPLYVSSNDHILSGLSRESITWAFTSGYASNWHPLTWLSHMLDYELFGLNPGRYHVVNLLFHVLNTLLLLTVLRQMTNALWKSAFVAALFAIHPLHVESVAWIAERKDVLSTFFWMLTLICYIRYAKNSSAKNYLLTLLTFAIGLTAKPMLVTLPCVLLLLDYWPLERIEKKNLSSRIFEKIPFFAFSAISSVITFSVQQSGRAVIEVNYLSYASRAANAIVSCLEYIEKMFWPNRLSVFYPYLVERLSIWRIAVAILLLASITVCVVRLASKHKYLPVGWFWFLGTLVPVIGLVQVGLQAMADRYTYLPLTGLFIMIAWGLPELLKNLPYRKIILATSASAVLAAFSICTWIQTGLWHNTVTLFEHALKVTDNNYLAYSLLAYSFRQQGKLDYAFAYDTKALQINAGYAPAQAEMGYILFQTNKLDEAIIHFKEALRVNPDLTDIYESIGKIFSLQGKLEESVDYFRQALLHDPLNAELHCELGTVLGRQGKFNEAVSHFNEALRIKPAYASAHSNLGYAFLNQNKFDKAVANLTQAVKLDPNSDKSHYYLALALSEKGRFAEAVTQFTESLRIKPDWVEPMNTLAWLLATDKDAVFYDPNRAVIIAKRACELTNNKNAEILDTLAVAYAAGGNFADAVTTAEKALNLSMSEGNHQMTEQIQKRIELYKADRPYAETKDKIIPTNE